MGKVEIDNTIQLIKLRNRESACFKGIISILSILFGMDLIALVQKTFTFHTGVDSQSLQLISFWGFMLMICACAYYTIGFKEYNDKHQIFPQNNKSRFLSYELFCYITFLKVQLFSLAIYFAQYVICLLLNRMKGNLALAYHFDLQFIVTGFVVNLIYGFIAMALIILIGAFDRKFKWIFRIICIGTLIVGLIFQEYCGQLLSKYMGILFKESSVAMFLIKASCLWIVLAVISYVVNNNTKDYRAEKKNPHMTFSVLVAFAIILLLVMFKVSSLTPIEGRNTKIVATKVEQLLTKDTVKSKVDISDILDESILKVKLSKKENEHYIIGGEVLTTSNNDEMLIEFTPSTYTTDWVNLNEFTESKLETRLEGNTLHLNITSKQNVNVVFLSAYSLMQQFDYFTGKQMYKEHSGSMGGNGSGTITIYYPKDIELSINEAY